MNCPCRTGSGYWVYADVRALTPLEEDECLTHAREKSAASRGPSRVRRARRERQDSVNQKSLEQHLAADIVGARGEKAWSIFWGVPWPKRINDFTNPDFDPDIEVRTTRTDPPELILRTRDMREKAHRRYVLIQERADGCHRLWGWVRPQEVYHLHAEDRGSRGTPARFVPTYELHRFPFYSKFPKKHRRPG